MTNDMIADVHIDPKAYYDNLAVCSLLGVRSARLTKDIRAGKLKASERAGKRFFRGEWLIEWLESEEAVAK